MLSASIKSILPFSKETISANSDIEERWWKDAVIYHIYPRSFQDSSNDGVGDLRGIADRLDYVQNLGVDAIWISPFVKSPMKDFGYDVSDYCAVDPIFGTMDDFEYLMAQADKHGLHVLMDLVFSHTSDQHKWFKESQKNEEGNPYNDYYVWADPKEDGTPPTNWLSHFGGPAWSWDSKRGQYYLHNFLSCMPDLNVHNEAVQEELLNVVRFWLDKGVSGFRLDVIDYYCHDPRFFDNPPAYKKPKRFEPYLMQDHRYNRNHENAFPFLKRMRAVCDEYQQKRGNSDIMMVAEISEAGTIEQSALYTAGDDLIHTSYCFDFLGHEFTPSHIKSTFEMYEMKAPEGWPSWSFSNHDTERVLTRWSQVLKVDDEALKNRLAKLNNALLMSLSGTVYLYQGQELGLENVDIPFDKIRDPYGKFQYPENKGRDGCRTPILWNDNANEGFGFTKSSEAWLPFGNEAQKKSVLVQDQDDESILAFTKKMIQLRKATKSLSQNADLKFIHADDQILIFERNTDSEKALCFFNISKEKGKFEADAQSFEPLISQGLELKNGAFEYVAFGFGILVSK
ncbi:MAG: alpha-glucosidase [Rickettsiales bacterium]|nr:alpha-glucosidase [Rickettsiales bacterium]